MIWALLIMKDVFLWIILGALGFVVTMLLLILIDNRFKDDANALHKWSKVTWLCYRLYLILLAYIIVFMEIHQ